MISDNSWFVNINSQIRIGPLTDMLLEESKGRLKDSPKQRKEEKAFGVANKPACRVKGPLNIRQLIEGFMASSSEMHVVNEKPACDRRLGLLL